MGFGIVGIVGIAAHNNLKNNKQEKTYVGIITADQQLDDINIVGCTRNTKSVSSCVVERPSQRQTLLRFQYLLHFS